MHIRTLLWLAVVVVLLGLTPASVKRAAAETQSYRASEITVMLRPNANINSFNARHRSYVLEQLPGANMYRLGWDGGASVEDKLSEVRTDADLLVADRNYLLRSPEVRQVSHAFLDQVSHAFLDNQSPASFYGQPAMQNLHLSEAQSYTRGANVRVAVIDTGIDLNHPLFAGRLAAPRFDFVDNDATPQDEPGGDSYGHGTFVAGLIALTAPQSSLIAIRAFGPDGVATSFDVAAAIRFAADNGAQVINMSFGLDQDDLLIKNALNYAQTRALPVGAAGNDNLNWLQFPASLQNRTLAVTATTDDDRKADFANYNAGVQVAAPGVALYSAYPGNQWAWWSGTSFSTALVSGEAALLLALNPLQTRPNLTRIITSGGVSLNILNPDYANQLGRVRIDYLAAINQSFLLRQ